MKPFSIFAAPVAGPGAFTLALALLATPAPAQISDQMIDDWADGAQEFMPDEPARPLDELLESRPEAAAPEAPQQEQPDPAIDDAPAQVAQGESPETPAGWDRREHFGFSVALPPEFEPLDEGRDEVLFGALDFETETGIIAFIGLERRDEILGDAEIIAQEPVQLAPGSVFTRVDLVIEDGPFSGVALGLLEQTAIPGDAGATILVTLLNMDWDDETRALAELVLETVAYFPPEPEIVSGLDGLLSYSLPDGWRVQRERAHFIDLLHAGMAGPSLNIGTGEAGRDMASLTALVFGESAVITGDFTESEGEILGHPARVFEGASAWVSGWQSRVHVLRECAPGNSPIVFDTIMPDAAQQAQIDAILERMTLNLPDDMAPCPEAIAPGVAWESAGQFAILPMEGMAARTSLRAVRLSPPQADRQFPEMRITANHPYSFDETFQVGNRFGFGFTDPPRIEETGLHGYGAYRFSGMGGADGQSWSLRAYLLQTCLADDVPIIVTLRRQADAAPADGTRDPMLEQLFLDLPEDARACPAELFEDAFERVQAHPDAAPERPEPAAPTPSAEQPDAAPPAPEIAMPDAPDVASAIRTAPAPRFDPQGLAGRLDNDHPRQRYAIDLPANGTLLLDVTTGEGLNLSHGVRLFDSDGETELYRRNHRPDTQAHYEVTHLRAGRYYLDLIKDSRAFYEGDYRVLADFRPASVPGDAEPNDEPGQAVSLELGLLVSGHLGFRGQERAIDSEDWYALDLPRSDTLILHVTTSGGGDDPIRPLDGNLNLHGGVFVHAADGETRLYGTRHLTSTEREHEIEGLDAGRYYVRLVKDGRQQYWGSYTLHARTPDMPAPVVPEIWPETSPEAAADDAADAPPPAPAPQADAEPGWTRHVTARFGTAVDYPAGLFTALPPPENEDGRAFEAPDGTAHFRIFAGHDVFDQSLGELMGEAIATGTMGRITRAELMGARAVIEGEAEGRRYLRVILDEPEAGVIHTLMIDYAEAEAARLAPVAERMADSFTVKQAAPAGDAPPAQDAFELSFWATIAESDDPAEFRAYLERWPQGTFAALAETRLRRLAQDPPPAPDSPDAPDPAPDAAVELAFWQSIAGSDDPADFRAYLDRWPQGEFAALAENRLRLLAPARPPASLPPPPPADPAAYTTPAVGSAERTAIMDAARIPVTDSLGQRVVFVVSTLRSSGSWAYLSAVPQLPDGRALDWSRTPYRDAWRADAMSDLVLVLLVNDGSGWQAIRHVIGPTDVAWYDWVEELGLPEALFFGR